MAQSPAGKPRIFTMWRGLIWQMLLVTILPLAVLTLAIAFISLSIHQHAMRDLVGERDERAVRTAAAALEEQLSHRQDAMRSLAILAGKLGPGDLAGFWADSQYLLDDYDGGLALFSSDGALQSHTGDRQLWESLATQAQPLTGTLLQNDHPASLISSRFTDPRNGEPVVLVLATSPGGEWIAAGASSATGLVRHTLMGAFATGTDASAVVVDASNAILYQSGSFPEREDPAAHPGIAEALRGETGVTYRQLQQGEHVITYSPITPVGWALVLEEPWETVDTPTLRLTQLAPLVLVPVLLLALVGLWFGLRWIIKPLQSLEARAATLATGEYGAIEKPVGGIAEIRSLQAELILLAHKVKAAQQSLHSYIGAITAGQEEERRRLARELHDDTLQSLIALKQRVQLAQMANANASATSSLNEVVALTEETIENVRRQTRLLRPIYLEDLGLVTALEMLAKETSHSAGIPITFSCEGSEVRLSPDVELALYRMAQEALSNVSRHSAASQASLIFSFASHSVQMQVIDNGAGFEVPRNPAEFAPAGHFGLLGLHERAELIGAVLEIHSQPGHGCRVSVLLPTNAH